MRFSSFTRLKRIIAWCLRFLGKDKHFRQYEDLQVQELENAEKLIVRAAQLAEFKTEIECLLKKKPLHKNSKILSLDPFLDKENNLRVGRRIIKSPLLYCSRH